MMDEEAFRAFVNDVKELLEQHGAELPPTDTGEPWGT